MPVLPPYRNQSLDLLCKSIHWFLYKRNNGTEWVKLIINVYEVLMNYMELSAITDTIHTKTVSGEKCCYINLKYLDDTASNKSEIIPSNKTLKFRDERKVLLFQQKLVLFYL